MVPILVSDRKIPTFDEGRGWGGAGGGGGNSPACPIDDVMEIRESFGKDSFRDLFLLVCQLRPYTSVYVNAKNSKFAELGTRQLLASRQKIRLDEQRINHN